MHVFWGSKSEIGSTAATSSRTPPSAFSRRFRQFSPWRKCAARSSILRCTPVVAPSMLKAVRRRHTSARGDAAFAGDPNPSHPTRLSHANYGE